MRTILRLCMIGVSLLSFYVAVFSQQVAKKISYPASPDGVIGFLEFRPSDYGSQKHPLIIFLHGVGERGNGTSQVGIVAYNALPLYCANGATMRFTVGGQTSSFVVLSPQLSTQYGYWPTYYVKEMIKYAKANLQIDPNRIYVTGLSLGGGGVWRVITDTENFDNTFDASIAAVAPICGTQEENDFNYCNTVAANHLPIWAFHCMDDVNVGVSATQHAEILSKNCGVTPASKFTYYQAGGHGGAWVNAYDTGHITRTVSVNGNLSGFTASPNLYEWFLSQTRSTNQTDYTAPVVSAGAAQSISLPLNLITLTGTGTGTNGATISSYSWTKTSGPAAGVISLPLLNTSLVTGLVQGVYVFTLTVTDNHGLSSTSNVTITVNPLFNQAPVANAGNNMNITLPVSSITLNGAGSDPDGTIASYNWSKTSGPASYSIVNAGAAVTTVNYLEEGVYVFTLKVTDNAGASSSSSVTIIVTPASNQVPVANAGGNTTITLPINSVSLDGSASYDPDGSIVAYYWVQSSGPSSFNIADVSAAKTTVSNLVAGVYVFTLQARDNAGSIGFSTKTITVIPGNNQTPVSNAGSNVTITLPTNSVSLDASASYDPDGSIVAYYWVQSSGPSSFNIADVSAAKTTVSNLVAGVYVFTLQVRDNAGIIGFSTKTITVNQAFTPPAIPANQIPVSNAGPDVSIVLPTNSVTLDAGASSDPDGKIVQCYWKKVSGPATAAIADPLAVNTTFSNLSQGVYVIELQVKDDRDALAYSYKTITVNPAPVSGQPGNQPPVSNAGPDVTISLPTNSVSLDASASYDPDGTIVAYYWVQNTGPSSYSIANVSAAKTTVSNLIPGVYVFTLQVRDNAGTIGFSTKTITVNPVSAGTGAQPIGYIRMSYGPSQACDDASSAGRIPIYGTSIANGSFVYADAAMTQKYDGGWNWFSFTPVLGGPVTQAFAIYPIGSIGLLTSCTANARMVATQQEKTITQQAELSVTPDAAIALPAAGKLIMYPNPVHTTATIELTSDGNNIKTINLYNSNGILKAQYKWQTIKGNNTFSLKNVSGLANGLYIIDIRDSNGKPNGKLKFIKM
ncbi:MAG TPA: PKD domain-containing protein [Chitinophagaceae bacterium]|nr:PKD domain-containing protein [Chitinophagaceae bacterium]